MALKHDKTLHVNHNFFSGKIVDSNSMHGSFGEDDESVFLFTSESVGEGHPGGYIIVLFALVINLSCTVG